MSDKTTFEPAGSGSAPVPSSRRDRQPVAFSSFMAADWRSDGRSGFGRGRAECPGHPSERHRTRVSPADLALVCPGAANRPCRNSKISGPAKSPRSPIRDSRDRRKACSQDLLGAGESGVVRHRQRHRRDDLMSALRRRPVRDYLGREVAARPQPTRRCRRPKTPPARPTVISSNANPASRFCGRDIARLHGILNCWAAQSHLAPQHDYRDLISCSIANLATRRIRTCVFYDVSVIPSELHRRPVRRRKRLLPGTGGASYNLPVKVSCPGEPTFTCQGPDRQTALCRGRLSFDVRNPDASCIGNFRTVSTAISLQRTTETKLHQPGAIAAGTLTMTFLPGP